MAKLRGKVKFKHPLPLFGEIWALERELDLMYQKGLPVGKQLGRVRSIINRWPNDDIVKQKTLKRWIKPAPNQMLVHHKTSKS